MHGRCLNGLFAVLAVGLSIAQLSVAASPPTSALAVHVETGDLRGTLTAGGARAWYGIPYAAPPVGDRRWRAPGRAPAWSDVRDASHAGSPCAQPSTAADGSVTIAGSEDCLTLNVFHPPGAIDRALPVMVWIHGGGQLYGTGATYDGTQLAIRQNVVVVTINYRLGPFGWFHHPAITGTGPKRTTGQFALLDTIAALKWVKRNIAAFGGDAHNVTLFGESAGAQNVYALLFAPSARGLFQRAIAESGGFWNMHLDQAVNARDAHVPGTPLSAHEVVNTLLVQHARAADRAAATRLQTTLSPQALAAWLRRLSAADVLAAYRGAPHLEYDFPSVVYDGVLLPRIDHRRALAVFRTLRDLGCTLSIDDFGTGYSSMSSLQQYPLNNLKIDISFVRRLDTSPEGLEIVKAIISLAHSLQLQVVAEGVERPEQQMILTVLQCEYAQGYLFSKPLPAQQAWEYIQACDGGCGLTT